MDSMNFCPAEAIWMSVFKSGSCTNLFKFFRRIDVSGHQRIIDRQITDMLLVGVLHFPRRARDGRTQKSFNHLAPDDIWMTMFAAVFWNHSPDILIAREKCRSDLLHGLYLRRRTIDQRDDGGIASPIEYFTQSYL